MKVLIIRFSSIGDVVLTTPVIRILKNQLKAEVHFLIKKKFISVLGANPYLDKVYEYDDNFNDIYRALKTEEYDYIIDLHCNLRSFIIRSFLGRPTLTYDKQRLKRWMRTKVRDTLSKDRHVADRYLDAVNPLGIEKDGKGLDFFIEEPNNVLLKSDDSSVINVALVPGAQHFTKRVPLDKVKNLIEASPQIHFNILGGLLEKDIGIELSKAHNVTNYCGLLNLQQSASIMAQSDFVISGDTGLMHIAAALSKNIIVLWGSTVKEFGFYPYYGKISKKYVNIEHSDLKCRPCTRIGKSQCPQGHFRCMTELSTSEVLLAMNILSEANHSA